MSMTSSMCQSMTGRPTRAQIANEQRRQSYGYYQNAKASIVLTSKDGKYSVGYTYDDNGNLRDEWETLDDGR